MDDGDVHFLVLAPFRDVVNKGRAALALAQDQDTCDDRADVETETDGEPMRKAAQSLVREGERALLRVEPVCRRLLDEYTDVFVNALRENEEIKQYRKSLNELLYDFDDYYLEPDQFDAAAFARLRALSREAAPAVYEVLISMRLEHHQVVVAGGSSSPEPAFSVASNLSRTASSTTSHTSDMIRFVGQQQQQQQQQQQSGHIDPLPSLGNASPDSSQCSTLAEPAAAEAASGGAGYYHYTHSQRHHSQPALICAPPPSTTTTTTTVNPRQISSSSFSQPPPPPPFTNGEDTAAAEEGGQVVPVVYPASMMMMTDDQQQQYAISPPSLDRLLEAFFAPQAVNGPNNGRPPAGIGGAGEQAADALPPSHPQPRSSSSASSRSDTDRNSRSQQHILLNMIPELPVASGTGTETRGRETLPPPPPPPPPPQEGSTGAGVPPEPTSPPSPLSPRPLALPRDSWLTHSSATLTLPPPVYEIRPPLHAAPAAPAEDEGMIPLPLQPRPPETVATEPPPVVAESADLEVVVPPPPDSEGLIPVSTERTSTERTLNAPRMQRVPDCTIDATSSFHLMKEFCRGGRDIRDGINSVTKVKKQASMMGFMTQTLAKCKHCMYELDWKLVEDDVAKKAIGSLSFNGIDYRPRFLQKSHLQVKYLDDPTYACLFCVHAGRTLEESDATVFFTKDQLLRHIARHPRPLPRVPGVVVVDSTNPPSPLSAVTPAAPAGAGAGVAAAMAGAVAASVGGFLSEDTLAVLRNDFDLVLTRVPERSETTALASMLAETPWAVAAQAHRPDRAATAPVRAPPDRVPALSLAAGQRVVGIYFSEQYQGEWAVGWADNEYAAFPLDVVRLQAPPRELVRAAAGGSSSLSAIARWKRAPRETGGDAGKGGEAAVAWLKFDSGDVIRNINYASVDYWCWSGYNAKGKWGIFPQAFIDRNTLKEEIVGSREGVSNGRGGGGGEASGGLFARVSGRRARTNTNGRPGSATGSHSSAEPRPTIQ